ncbi:MAG: VWA-like domain-containing protein [Anaerovoracaceae bacterium]|jgi:hypothetical protein
MTEQNETKEQKVTRLAAELLELTRSRLSVSLRYLAPALLALEPEPMDLTGFPPLRSAGLTLFYDPKELLRMAQKDPVSVARAYLHTVLHSLFRHPFQCRSRLPAYWDLACDIADEALTIELEQELPQPLEPPIPAEKVSYPIAVGAPVDTPPEEPDPRVLRRETLAQLQEKVPSLAADPLYQYLIRSGLPRKRIRELADLFRVDDHTAWYQTTETRLLYLDKDEQEERTASGTIEIRIDDEEMDEAWKRIAKRIQLKHEFTGKEKGDGSLNLTEDTGELNLERYSYEDFLRHLSTPTETIGVNDAEFDNIFYTYGLELYGDMPLIEPLEYKETPKIRDLVIAIDTSESTSGSLVQTFLNKTYNILMQQESFASRFNLYIIQCDSVIEDVVRITCRSDIQRYIANMKIHGLGGTDFRPVFEYVDELIYQGKFQDLKGIIYFTDGHGTFPEKAPSYEAAFVFIRQYYDDPPVPPWAEKLMLNEGDLDDSLEELEEQEKARYEYQAS